VIYLTMKSRNDTKESQLKSRSDNKESQLRLKIVKKSKNHIEKIPKQRESFTAYKNQRRIHKQSESFIEDEKGKISKDLISHNKVSHSEFKIVKKPISNMERRIPKQCSDLHSKDYHVSEICNEEKKKDSYESCNKIDESHDLIQSISDFVIPGDIPENILNIGSSSSFANQIFSEFFDTRTSPSQTFDQEQDDFTKSIVDFVIPGDIPDVKLLELENINSLLDFFKNV